MKKINKKGYTLIEILAVVIILGILLLIAVPAINKQLNQFRVDYYSKVESSGKAAGKDYISDKRYSKPTKLLHSKVVKLEVLEREGYLSDEVKDYVGEKCDAYETSYSYFIVVKTGDKKFEYATCLKCSGDEYYTDTSAEKYDLCNYAWTTNDNIEYVDDGTLKSNEPLYVYYGTNEQTIKKDVGLKYNITKKDDDGKVLATLGIGEAVYPKNLNELVGKNVNTKITLNYEFPDGQKVSKDAIIYKHGEPKITMTYINDKVVNGVTEKTAGSAYTSGEWSNGVRVKIEFNDNDVDEIINAVNIQKVEYYDEVTKTWTTICNNVDADSCIWNRTSDINKTVKFRITNDKGHKSDISSSYTIRVDANPPSCGTKVQNNTWTNTSKTVSVGCVDNGGSACKQVTYSETYPKTGVANKKTTSIRIYDTAGNSTTCSLNVYVDTTPPSTCSLTLKDSTGKTYASGSTVNTDVDFSITAVDSETDNSGIASYYGVVNGNNYSNSSSFENGNYSIVPTCKDNAGNVKTGTTVTMNYAKYMFLTLNANGGTCSNTSIKCIYGKSCTISPGTCTNGAYTLTGWTEKSDGSGTVYTNSITLTSNKTLYARWEKIITVTFKGNGSNTSDSTKTCKMINGASSCNITSPAISAKSGFTAVGWNTSASGTTSGWAASSSKAFSANATYYAITKSNSAYTATFTLQDTAAATASAGSVSCYRYNGASSCTITSPTLTAKSGYTVVGWNTSKTATSYTVKSGEKITLTSNPTYYSITYKGTPITITFDKNKASSVGNSKLTCYLYNGATSCSITAPSITPGSGWTAIGFGTGATSTSSSWDVGASKSVSANATYYAIIRSSSQYTATFNKNAASSISKTSASCYRYNGATSCNVTSPTITPGSGWTALGFNSSASATSSSWNANTSAAISGNVTYYAIIRSSSQYTATFDKNKASSISKTSASCYRYNGATSCSVTSPSITAGSGWEAVGFNTSASATSSGWNASTSKSISSNVTYYAIIKSSSAVTITFNKNKASSVGSTSLTCYKYNGASSCSITAPSITAGSGWTAVGFNTSASATSSGWNVGAAKSVSSNTTYYAIIKSSSAYTITFNKNTASSIGATSQSCYRYNGATSCSVTAPSITPKTYYSAVGWNTSASATSSGWNAGAAKSISANATYYAITSAKSPSCGTASVTGSGTTRDIKVLCVNPDDNSACTAGTGTVTTNGTHSVTIKGSNGVTKSCSVTVSGIATKPVLAWYGHSTGGSCSITCPSGSYYSAFNVKWGFNISGPTLTSDSYQYTYYNYNGNNAGLEYKRTLGGTVTLGKSYNWGCGNTTQTEMWFSRSHCSGGGGETTRYSFIQANACSAGGCSVDTGQMYVVKACGC